jgi:N-acetylglucosamine transport system permease protein
MRHGKYPFIIGFLVVPLALYGMFVINAYVQMFNLSTTDWTGFGSFHRVGFDNFK